MQNHGPSALRLDVFGREVLVTRTERGWVAFDLGPDGTRRPAYDLPIPPTMEDVEIGRYLADLCHEWATPQHPAVKRLDADPA